MTEKENVVSGRGVKEKLQLTCPMSLFNLPFTLKPLKIKSFSFSFQNRLGIIESQ